ncbi:MAG: hypothetical protein NT02SARS_1732 [SAR86 cluster bacterium SAR86B]|uniref:Uncharacterized protein n=1 Tax=SAR86 cluster bacterium SAR86B TaxID=1123867 RepID=J5KJN6_9GAMM|nr:MAG: hypothetical protein NT02SARS_1732 [SAR86 cluster bacterium SAR86B]
MNCCHNRQHCFHGVVIKGTNGLGNHQRPHHAKWSIIFAIHSLMREQPGIIKLF